MAPDPAPQILQRGTVARGLRSSMLLDAVTVEPLVEERIGREGIDRLGRLEGVAGKRGSQLGRRPGGAPGGVVGLERVARQRGARGERSGFLCRERPGAWKQKRGEQDWKYAEH